jgi:hypothetical protein
LAVTEGGGVDSGVRQQKPAESARSLHAGTKKELTKAVKRVGMLQKNHN